MKRSSCCVMGVLCVVFAATVASADYLNPPGWEDNPYFTHQSWDFIWAEQPIAPDGPGPVVSPGDPECWVNLSIPGGWLQSVGIDPDGNERLGGWEFLGPISPDQGPLMDFVVPNRKNPDLFKEIWLQMTLATNAADPFGQIFITVEDETGVTTDFEIIDVIEPVDPDLDPFVTVTGLVQLDHQPPEETVSLYAVLGSNEYLIIDQFDIDTRCVPEPATFALLAVVGFGVIAWRRSR